RSWHLPGRRKANQLLVAEPACRGAPKEVRTALDTNIVSALWSSEPLASRIAADLSEAHARGGLVICAPVYAELLAHPSATLSFLQLVHVRDAQFELSRSDHLEYGTRARQQFVACGGEVSQHGTRHVQRAFLRKGHRIDRRNRPA